MTLPCSACFFTSLHLRMAGHPARSLVLVAPIGVQHQEQRPMWQWAQCTSTTSMLIHLEADTCFL